MSKISIGFLLLATFLVTITLLDKSVFYSWQEFYPEKGFKILVNPLSGRINDFLSADSPSDKIISDFSALKQGNENKCINGKDPAKLSQKEQLLEFIKGPCAPMVIVPGILGTSLRLQITDCEKLRQNHPQIFSDCSWYSCSQNWFVKLLGYSPADEYTLWVAIDNTMGLLSFQDHHSRCFGGLIASYYNSSETSLEKM